MRRMVLAVSLTAIAVAVLATVAHAQPTLTARGTVSAIAGDTVTVATADKPMTFTVDAKTVVTAEGAGTASRAAEAAGKGGPKLSELLKVGEPVEVSYHDIGGGKLHAASFRRMRSAGGGSSTSTSDAPKTETASGTVDAVSQSSLTITGAGAVKQTFAIDGETRVIGHGAGTAASKGKVTAPDLMAVGDRVSVSYHKMGASLHAAEIRVTAKK
jgi:Domain of unknown function (DUF5666)